MSLSMVKNSFSTPQMKSLISNYSRLKDIMKNIRDIRVRVRIPWLCQ